MTEDNTLFNSNDHHGFSIESIATCADSKASHQIVIMKEDRCYHESLPSAGELFVLLQWILGGIETNRYYMSKHRRHERPHHDFPVCLAPSRQ